eukprot:TRINITY_DN6604_c1_g1_i4.p1 TRINITY_DN6604_c1_g1~~TRINITY_DN6604_c1_g1_i4.p1  ORF type:complete len:199 (-),score=21.30 TRINITY_DN6604_c1_g1_i4:420-1016(-)
MVYLTLYKPRWEEANDVLQQAGRPNYKEEGKTEDKSLKSGQWMIDEHQVQLGKGKKAYQKAKQALQQWDQFQLDWACVPAAKAIPLKNEQLYAVCARTAGIWNSNPLKVQYISENHQRIDKTRRKIFSVGSGTLRGHMLAGEESFQIEWNKKDDSVWYKIYTFSRPSTPLAVLTYPIVRLQQRRFAKDSIKKMQELIA